eukprot:NODE_2260_length_1248_cov_76.864053_g2059_i0.p1 GENE.NODE_2260_length_1248_cov_76.864053_g2059_i0~~NODE_2260_length_1248_cov_76.864053_g2059_i0.p1  ORF type:complete len:364 (-),score=40.99 NODE_2260_length_1248_cov_76.864053_g2059_i0:89-1180(-)
MGTLRHMVFLATFLGTVTAFVHPFDVPWFNILSECRLQCPSTSPSTVSSGEFQGVTIENHFYLANDATMALAMSKDVGGRCELRHNPHWSSASLDEVRFTARLKFDPSNIESFTFMQIHAKDFAPFRSGPLLMVNWRQERDGLSDHLWASVRMDLDEVSKSKITVSLGSRPTGFFDLDVAAFNDLLQIKVNGVLKHQQSLAFWSSIQQNYFKTGTYLHGNLVGPSVVFYEQLWMKTPGSTLLKLDERTPAPAPSPSPAGPYVAFSRNADRTSSQPVEGAQVQGTIYVFVHASPEEESLIASVTFNLDGVDFRRERRAPFDLVGGSQSAANPFDASTLSAGVHTLRTKIVFEAGTVLLVDNFTV